MKKELSAVEALREAGFKENPNMPNVALFFNSNKKKISQEIKSEKEKKMRLF